MASTMARFCARAEIHDGQINIVQCEAENIECVLRTIYLYLAACALLGEITPVVSYEDNIPFHTINYVHGANASCWFLRILLQQLRIDSAAVCGSSNQERRCRGESAGLTRLSCRTALRFRHRGSGSKAPAARIPKTAPPPD